MQKYKWVDSAAVLATLRVEGVSGAEEYVRRLVHEFLEHADLALLNPTIEVLNCVANRRVDLEGPLQLGQVSETGEAFRIFCFCSSQSLQKVGLRIKFPVRKFQHNHALLRDAVNSFNAAQQSSELAPARRSQKQLFVRPSKGSKVSRSQIGMR
jgi:hypothetical protein